MVTSTFDQLSRRRGTQSIGTNPIRTGYWKDGVSDSPNLLPPPSRRSPSRLKRSSSTLRQPSALYDGRCRRRSRFHIYTPNLRGTFGREVDRMQQEEANFHEVALMYEIDEADDAARNRILHFCFRRSYIAQSTADEWLEVNLGSEGDYRPTFLSQKLDEQQAAAMINLLYEFQDCFAWSYDEMPGLDPDVAVHHWHIKKDARPVAQPPRRIKEDHIPQMEESFRKCRVSQASCSLNMGFKVSARH